MSEIEFNLHYITYYGQDLYILFTNGDEVPMKWTYDHMWVGRKSINGPEHLEWYYVVKVGGNVQRYEEVQGVREFDFDGSNCSVRDWWYYPHLTNVHSFENVKKETEEKVKKSMRKQN